MIDIDIPAVLALLKAHAWIALAAILVGLLVRVLKSDVKITPTIPARYRPFLALALGQLAAVLDHVASGTPWRDAAIGGFIAAVVAMVGHEAAIEKLRGGQELGAPKPEAIAPLLLMVYLVLGPSACGAQQRIVDAATVQANAMHELASEAGLVIREQCVAAYEAATAAEVPTIDRACMPATRAYLKIRAVWTREAALLAMRPPPLEQLGALEGEASRAASELESAMRAFGGRP